MTERIIRSEILRRLLVRLLSVSIGTLALNSCVTLDLLSKDVRSINRDKGIAGRVKGADTKRIKVLVLRKGEGDQLDLADATAPNSLGDFAFVLPAQGSYFLAAVESGGGMKRRTANRLVAIYGSGSMEEIPGTRQSDATKLVLNAAGKIDGRNPALGDLRRMLRTLSPEPVRKSSAIPIACGDVISLDDPLFDEKTGRKGLWAPVTSAKLHGIGIHFLEKYDPGKIPVVFVHGHGGTPRTWRPMIESLDRKRYQPWLYSYPSGMPLEIAAGSLANLMNRLEDHYHPERGHVVAHSMGGLVARRAVQILSNESGRRYIASLTTLSTPWNGAGSAVIGALGMPVAVPCWWDMCPNSKFIRKILTDPLPVPHLLVSTDKSSFNPTLPLRNDGTVSIASQLDPRALSKASDRLVVHEDHDGVLDDAGTKKAVSAFFKAKEREGRMPK